MASQDEIIARLKESKPPATDSFTYLTIVEKSLSPEILPALRDILDDAELTSEIGWDMVEMLLAVPGSGECLERIARLGNPREVIIKILEILDKDATARDGEDEPEAGDSRRFVTLVGMLGVLHKRLQVKRPSRFVHTTLQAVADAYDPRSAEATQAVIDLARSLSGKKRPPLPTRQSSTKLDTPFKDADSSVPDPEAVDGEQAPSKGEERLCERLVLSFVTCVLEQFVTGGGVSWAGRLLEYTWPEKIVSRKVTMLQAYKEVPELQAKDALVGQLVAIAKDMGLARITEQQMAALVEEPIHRTPLKMEDVDPEDIYAIKLSTGGVICLIAYWLFSADIFDARHDQPTLVIFPDVHRLLHKFLGGDEGAMDNLLRSPGIIEALLVIAIHVVGTDGVQGISDVETDGKSQYMAFHHLLTLISVFHHDLIIRNAATTLAGHVLHADPSPIDRLAILEDLLENCEFAALQACAVTWLREELIAAQSSTDAQNPFALTEAVEKLQYALFPSLAHLANSSAITVPELWEFWTANAPFLIQAANFAVFLMAGTGWMEQTPNGMKVAVAERYVAPLLEGVKRLEEDIKQNKERERDLLELTVLKDALERVSWQ